MADLHKNDIGTKIVLFIRNNGSAWTEVQNATTMKIKLTPISTEETQEFTASFAQSPDGTGDGTDGKIEYVTTATGDLPVAGRYEVQGYLVIPGVFTGHTKSTRMMVGDTR